MKAGCPDPNTVPLEPGPAGHGHGHGHGADEAEYWNSQHTEPALERVPQIPLLPALLETVQQTLFHPRQTFEHMAVRGSVLRPLLFAVLMGVLVSVAMWSLLEIFDAVDLSYGMYIFFLDDDGLAIFALYANYFANLFIGSGVAHLVLKLLARQNASYERAFRVFAYVYGSTFILLLVPFFGYAMREYWAIFAGITALRAAHQVALWHAIAAVLTSMLVVQYCIKNFFPDL